jgi:hypothetical protein
MSAITITLKENNEAERQTEKMLRNLLAKYQLVKWVRCRDILIEQGSTGKAFPVIRLSAWRSDSENKLLAQFLHEQFHWIEKDNETQMEKAIDELKLLFPNAPLEKPQGAGTIESTYKHLIICRLEFLVLEVLLGFALAKDIIMENLNYTWIRREALDYGSQIDTIIEKYFPGVMPTKAISES